MSRVRIDQDEYQQIVRYVEKALNYAGIAPHNVDGVAHMVKTDGLYRVVVEEVPDDFSDATIYLVDEELYAKWRKKTGYNI